VSFNKQQERIKVPFAALSAFVDPSVRFGLQFDRARTRPAGLKRPTARHPARRTAAGDKRPPLAAPTGSEATPRKPVPAETEGKPEDAAFQGRQTRQLPKEVGRRPAALAAGMRASMSVSRPAGISRTGYAL